MSDLALAFWFGVVPSVLTLAYLWRKRPGHGEGVKPTTPKPRPRPF
jgi:hypothetical protein